MIFDGCSVPFLRNPTLYPQFMPPTIIISITNTLVITEIMSMARHHLWNKRNCPIHIVHLSNILVGNCPCGRQYLRIHYSILHSAASVTCVAALLLGNNSPIKNIHNASDARVNNMEDSMTQLSTDSTLEVVNRKGFLAYTKERHDPYPSQSIVPDIVLSKQSIQVIQSNMLNSIVADMDDKKFGHFVLFSSTSNNWTSYTTESIIRVTTRIDACDNYPCNCMVFTFHDQYIVPSCYEQCRR
jgi:hypothetical protein